VPFFAHCRLKHLILLLTGLVLLCPVLTAAQSFAPNPDWRFESFNSQNHFVGGEIHSIAMDKHGYLWTCSRGVQRFDGHRTVDYNSFLTGNNAIRSNSANILALWLPASAEQRPKPIQ